MKEQRRPNDPLVDSAMGQFRKGPAIHLPAATFYHQWRRLSINGRCHGLKAGWACQATPTDAESRTARCYRVTQDPTSVAISGRTLVMRCIGYRVTQELTSVAIGGKKSR